MQGCVKIPSPELVQASKGAYADSVRVSWSAVAGVTGYIVYFKENIDSKDYEELRKVYQGSSEFENRQIFHKPSNKDAIYLYDVVSVLSDGLSVAKDREDEEGGFLLNEGFLWHRGAC